MRSVFFFSFVLLLLRVSAFDQVGALERLWYWYAYSLDGLSPGKSNTIAPGCAKTFNIKGRCNFVQFMDYIQQGSPNVLNPRAIESVDPMNIPATFQALVNGQYTGTYDCTHVYQGLGPGENGVRAIDNVAGLFGKLGYFCSGRLSNGPANLQENLNRITTAVLRGREGNSFSDWQTQMSMRDPPINLVSRMIALYDGLPAGNTAMQVQEVDMPATYAANDGMDEGMIDDALTQARVDVDPGHFSNVHAAQTAQALVSDQCHALSNVEYGIS